MLTWIKRIVVLVVLIGLVVGGIWWYRGRDAEGPVEYRTAKVTRGEILSTISATGTLEPEEVIDVGSQVTGQIQKFGTDTAGKQVDYHSNVKAGSLLALIDPTTYEASVTEAKAQLAQAQAAVQRAQADKITAEAKLTQARNDWQRAEKIGPGDALAQTTYDTYKSDFEQAQAAVAVADASLASAKATVDQSDSAVKRAQRNLDYCTINSPVDGVVIDRRVNIGQTVVSTQSASSLFLIAKDLRQMQVWVAVNEADIGNIHVGQAVTFTCDAFGDRVFKGTVEKMRLNAQMTQNVVVYTVEVQTSNADLTLLPYLTANVDFEVQRADNVLNVPNAALRWTPSPEQIVPSERDKYAAKMDDKGAEHGNWGGNGESGDALPKKPHKKDKATGKPGTLWVKDGDFVKPIPVTTGVTDGASTAIIGGDLQEGADVITGVQITDADAGSQGPTNPFMPQMRRRH